MSPLRSTVITAIVTASLAALGGTAAADDTLRIEGVELTSSMLGAPVRSFALGEAVVIRFRCSGIGTNDAGELRLETGIRIKHADGQLVVDQPRGPGMNGKDLFSSERVPAFFMIPPQLLRKPGRYEATLLATDSSSASPRKASAKVSFEIAPLRFALGNPRLCLDPQGNHESRGPFKVGQTIFLCQSALGFARGREGVDLQVDVEVRRGSRTIGVKNNLHRVQGPIEQGLEQVSLNAILSLSKSGRFEVVVTVLDRLADKRLQTRFDITVEAHRAPPARPKLPSFGE
jgi:hypothetical protein